MSQVQAEKSNCPFISFIFEQQQKTIKQLEALEESKFNNTFFQDKWSSPNGSKGITAIFENGQTFERAGVNVSHVFGDKLPSQATVRHPNLADNPYEACGISLVAHPQNPFAPTAHLNVRVFKITTKKGLVWWFGGGFDLTPHYPFKEDCQHFHQQAYNSVAETDEKLYKTFKENCDNYFFLPHRNEMRGIGGLFFDDYCTNDFAKDSKLAQNIAEGFLKAYLPIINKRKNTPYKDHHKKFQALRRGRYVEFNLLYDRGTLFGLKTGRRTESVLMSMPPTTSWGYRSDAFTEKFDEFNEDTRALEPFLQPNNWLKHFEYNI